MTVGRPRRVSDDEVFAAVAQVVSAQGPVGTTLGRVAQVVGLTPAALVHRFGSKHQLLVTFAGRSADRTEAVFDRHRRGTTPVTALRRAMRELALDVRTPAELANHLAFLQLDLVDPALRPSAVRQARVIQSRLRSLIVDAVAAGELLACDDAELASGVYTAWNGAHLTWALDGRGTISRWIDRAVVRVLRPLLAFGDHTDRLGEIIPGYRGVPVDIPDRDTNSE